MVLKLNNKVFFGFSPLRDLIVYARNLRPAPRETIQSNVFSRMLSEAHARSIVTPRQFKEVVGSSDVQTDLVEAGLSNQSAKLLVENYVDVNKVCV